MKNNRKHFQTLDALRFFAFFKVFLFHIPIWSFPVLTFVKEGGGTAVTFFFALSGFLITYIILEEKKATGTFNMQAFYIRRILRIWPLYFIMVLFAFMTPVVLRLLSLTSSAEGYEPNWLLSVTFLENYKMIATNSFPNVSPLGVMWSVCVEEHFYILWALSLYFISTRNLFWLIACSIITANISRYVFYLHDRAFLDLLTNMDYFAYGAIPAWLLIQRKEEATVFFTSLSVTLKITVLIAGVGMIIILPNLNVEDKILMEPTILGSIYALLLTLIVFEEELFHIPQKNIFSRLGVYTYGFYLTHTIVINFFVKIFDTENVTPVVALLFITICLLGTVIAGMATYYSIERPFLKLKKRFS